MTQIYPAQYVVNEKGQKTAVLMPIAAYEQLLEDLHDLAMFAQRRDEETFSLKELIERLGIDNELQHSVQTGS